MFLFHVSVSEAMFSYAFTTYKQKKHQFKGSFYDLSPYARQIILQRGLLVSTNCYGGLGVNVTR